MCSAFLHFTPGHLILVRNFGHCKVHFQNNCVQFWVWVNTFLEKMLCVVVCGDRITLECVDNVHFRGGSPHFHQTKLKEGKILFG
jgi:hypothetical protein